MSNVKEEFTESINGAGPGAVLRQARESARLSLQDVSDATRITVSRLAALEADDYDNAGMSAAFLVGYIRTYAKLLGIPSQPLVDAVEGYVTASMSAADADAMEAAKNMSRKPPKTSLHIGRWAGFATIILLGWVLVHLFYSSPESQPKQSASILERSEQANPDGVPAVEQEQAQNAGELPVVKVNRISTVERARTVEQTQIAELEGETLSLESSLSIDEQTNDASLEISDNPTSGLGSELSSELNTESTRELKLSPSQPEPPASGGVEANQLDTGLESEGLNSSDLDSIRIAFSEDCWLEIRDSNGEVVDIRLASAGDVVSAKGLAPFDVKFGNAAAANLSVNGRNIPIKPRPGKKTLRIQVGP